MHTNVCSGKTENLGKGVVDLDIDGRVINLKICCECVNWIQTGLEQGSVVGCQNASALSVFVKDGRFLQ